MPPDNFVFRLPLEMRTQLAEYGDRHDMNLGQVVRLALRRFLKDVELNAAQPDRKEL